MERRSVTLAERVSCRGRSTTSEVVLAAAKDPRSSGVEYILFLESLIAPNSGHNPQRAFDYLTPSGV